MLVKQIAPENESKKTSRFSVNLHGYLFANPSVLTAFEIVFLNGRRKPVIERVELPPNMLGMGFRSFLDLGIKEQDPRAAVTVKGEA